MPDRPFSLPPFDGFTRILAAQSAQTTFIPVSATIIAPRNAQGNGRKRKTHRGIKKREMEGGRNRGCVWKGGRC